MSVWSDQTLPSTPMFLMPGRRRARRVGGNHVQQLHLDRVGQIPRQCVGVPGHRVDRGQLPGRAFERAADCGVAGRVPGDIDVRRRVGVHLERGCDPLLGGEQASQVAVQLADLAVRARRRDAVTVGRAGRAADEVVALVGSEHEQRVRLVDAVLGQPREELPERVVVRLQGGDVAGLSRPVCGPVRMRVVRVRNVRVGDRDAVLLHRRHVAQRHRRRHAIKTGETDVA